MSDDDNVKEPEGPKLVVDNTTDQPTPENVFYLIEINTGKEVIRISGKDATKAAELTNAVVKTGTYSMAIENGFKTYPVVSASMTGPYRNKTQEEKEAEANPEGEDPEAS